MVSLSKALLSLWWQTDASEIGTMTSHDGSVFEGVRGREGGRGGRLRAALRYAQPMGAQGGVSGGREAVRPGSDTAHLQMEMKYQRQSISRL